MTAMVLAKALNSGMRAALAGDDKVLLMGEDIGKLGGVFRVTDGLQAEFGAGRVVDTPLAESGIVGTAIGLALRGYRPVCEIQFDGFVFPAFDQITTQLAKMHSRTRGRKTVPVVIRIPYGGGIGAVEHHSESPEALFAHTAGLRVVSPSNPADAYVMMQEAIACDDPVIFLEPKGQYWTKGEVDLATGPYGGGDLDALRLLDRRDAAGRVARDEPIEATALVAGTEPSSFPTLNKATVAREGTDLTLLAYGPSVSTALKVAAAAHGEGTSIEVIDLRAISPIDMATVTESVAKTGRAIVVHEAPVFFGAGAELAARVTEACFYELEAPVLRVGGFHTPYPPAKIEHDYLPGLDRVLDAVDRSLAY